MYRLLAFSFLLFCSSLYAAPQHFIIDTTNTRIHLSWHTFGDILSWAQLNGVRVLTALMISRMYFTRLSTILSLPI